jgi:hypothetical protein
MTELVHAYLAMAHYAFMPSNHNIGGPRPHFSWPRLSTEIDNRRVGLSENSGMPYLYEEWRP